MNRNFRITLLISLALHILWMSAVVIVSPERFERPKVHTRVNFLGPILRKTAFDIMLENVNPVVKTTYRRMTMVTTGNLLEIKMPKKEVDIQGFPEYLEKDMDFFVKDFLRAYKVVPDFALGFDVDNLSMDVLRMSNSEDANERQVIYKSGSPSIIRGLYGDKTTFKVKVNVLISKDGNVKKAEPLTTTGYPQLDIAAVEFVRGWIFEPAKRALMADEWREVEVIFGADN